MTVEQIMKLVEAGFTAEQITALSSASASAPAQETASAPAQATAPAQAQETAQEQSVSMSDVMCAIAELNKSIKAMNIGLSVQPASATETVDDILASIINP